jgi:hypothetical protein
MIRVGMIPLHFFRNTLAFYRSTSGLCTCHFRVFLSIIFGLLTLRERARFDRHRASVINSAVDSSDKNLFSWFLAIVCH